MPLDSAPDSPLPLPEGWSLSERVDDVVQVEALTIRRAGLCATSEHGQAVGSAAALAEDPTPRATFELLERIGLLEAIRPSDTGVRLRTASGEDLGNVPVEEVFPLSDAPNRWAFARSNGVSLHVDWTSACNGAVRELTERDRVLRAWLGQTQAIRIDGAVAPLMVSGVPSYDWRAYLFPPPEAPAIRPDLEVVGVFGFPRARHVPFVFGYGAGTHRSDAVRSAETEALQLLAFLWGEPIPDVAPEPLPVPMTHLETYQVRAQLETVLQWLDEGHAAYHRPVRCVASESVRFADLTPSWLSGRLHVAKATCPAAIALTFGRSPLFAHLPSHLQIHPIP